MKEIKIYGEIVPFQDAWVEADGFCNLSVVQRQLDEANGDDVKVRINSFGGDVDEGFAIYSELRRYAKDKKAKITTTAEGRCASIATVIFLAGDTRIVNPYVEPFVHNAWTYAIGDAKQIQRIATDLNNTNQKIAQHYADHTSLTKDEAIVLMEEETSISADECVEIRFATEKEDILRPVALRRILNKNHQSKNRQMPKNKKKKSIWNQFKEWAEGKGILNKIVFTAEQEELDFYELEDDDTISVGAKARINGEDADGSYEVPNEENPDQSVTYVFSSGELTEITEPEEDGDGDGDGDGEDNEEMNALKEENENLRTQLQEAQNSVSERDETIKNLKEKNTSYKAAINKIKDLESEEEVPSPGRKKPKKPETEAKKSAASKAIANLKKRK